MHTKINQWDFFKQSLPEILLLELFFKLLATFMIMPFITFLFEFMLTITGYQLAFNSLILGFFLTIPGFITIIISLLIAVAVSYLEFASLIILFNYQRAGLGLNFKEILKQATLSLSSLKHWSSIGFALYILGLLPVMSIGFSASLVPWLQIPNFVSGELTKNSWGIYVLVAVVLFLVILMAGTLYILPEMVLSNQHFDRALINSFKKNCAAFPKKIAVEIRPLIGIISVTWLPKFIIWSQFNQREVNFPLIIAYFGYSWKSTLLILLVVLSWATSFIFMPYLLSVVMTNYFTLTQTNIKPPQENLLSQLFELGWQKSQTLRAKIVNLVKQPRIRRFLVGILALLFSVNLIRLILPAPALHEPIVIGHRGSLEGVENSAGAIQGAIDAGADYTEVDLLLSADGVPMVIHDSNLQRLAGINKNIYEMTAAELQQITLKQGEFEGEIMTLEDTIELVKGKINLTIELKLHGHEQKDIVVEVMNILENHDLMDSSLFISLEYTLLEKIKDAYPETLVGYCVYGNVGQLSTNVLISMAIDFIVIEESMATPKVISDFRQAWLPVYVWTVNDEVSMKKYLNMGIIGLVTDYPATGMKQVKSYNSVSKVEYIEKYGWYDQ